MLAVYVPILLTVAICIFARQIGDRLGVVDVPDSLRKSHPDPTPLVGGIAIMLPLAVWSAIQLFTNDGQGGLEQALMLCAGGVAVVGYMDDQRIISPTGRLILLAIFSFVALKLDPQLVVHRIHTVSFGSLTVSPELAVALVVVSLTGFSCAVNMVDGANGLVLSLICIWSVCLAIWGGVGAGAAELLAGASFVTLLFNARGRLFLGDCGAFAVSFAIGLIAIQTHNQNNLPLETVIVWFFLPVADCLRLIPVRLMRRRSPFRPDRLHFHHRLTDRFGTRRAIWGYVGLVGVTSLLATLIPGWSVWCICLDGAVYGGVLVADAIAWPGGKGQSVGKEGSLVVPLAGTHRKGT
ncbi:MAG: MraY family glycosyltransferase [Rhizomicrobium sp.]|jgi:UDP-GlcNAc:undecaprenyl-phosphate GlcNAc-1-phosphate transferase